MNTEGWRCAVFLALGNTISNVDHRLIKFVYGVWSGTYWSNCMYGVLYSGQILMARNSIALRTIRVCLDWRAPSIHWIRKTYTFPFRQMKLTVNMFCVWSQKNWPELTIVGFHRHDNFLLQERTKMQNNYQGL